jgi:hypothetical protein
MKASVTPHRPRILYNLGYNTTRLPRTCGLRIGQCIILLMLLPRPGSRYTHWPTEQSSLLACKGAPKHSHPLFRYFARHFRRPLYNILQPRAEICPEGTTVSGLHMTLPPQFPPHASHFDHTKTALNHVSAK